MPHPSHLKHTLVEVVELLLNSAGELSKGKDDLTRLDYWPIGYRSAA